MGNHKGSMGFIPVGPFVGFPRAQAALKQPLFSGWLQPSSAPCCILRASAHSEELSEAANR